METKRRGQRSVALAVAITSGMLAVFALVPATVGAQVSGAETAPGAYSPAPSCASGADCAPAPQGNTNVAPAYACSSGASGASGSDCAPAPQGNTNVAPAYACSSGASGASGSDCAPAPQGNTSVAGASGSQSSSDAASGASGGQPSGSYAAPAPQTVTYGAGPSLPNTGNPDADANMAPWTIMAYVALAAAILVGACEIRNRARSIAPF